MTHDDIWKAIEMFAAAHNLTCSALARVGGLDPTAFNRSKRFSKVGQPRWPSTLSISKILSATDTKFEDFVKFMPQHEK